MEILEKSEVWDAIVVGSGANGGVAARQLAEAGLRVLVLEAGPPVEYRGDYGKFVKNVGREVWRHYVTKRQHVQKMHATYWTTNPDFFVDDIDNPYTTPKDKPFRWIRGRNLGGRSLTWDGVTPRFSDYEFKAASRDGIGPDWPIAHADLAPYYGSLERFFGICGSKDALAQLPDGDYQASGTLTPSERIFKARIERKFPERKVIVSRGIRAGRTPGAGEIHSRLSSQATTLEAAKRTGRVTVRTNAVVSRILIGREANRATGVEIIDAITHEVQEYRGKLIFLCASTIESLRILMNSKSNAHPEGIGASSGVLGHYLMDHIASTIYFHLPDVRDDGGPYQLQGGEAMLIPRFQNLTDTREAYPRGFGLWGGIQRLPLPKILRKKRGEAVGFLCARAEVLPHRDNKVMLDPQLKDAWGLPAAHIDFDWQPDDLRAADAGRQATKEMIAEAGGKVADVTELFHTPMITGFLHALQKEWVRSTPGLFCHEVGGARMGVSPRDSVVDPHCRAWDARNVFVTDGACWPSCGWQNPTLTEMALTARACDHAVAELKGQVTAS